MYPGASSLLQSPTPSNPRPAAGLRPCPFPSCAKQFTHQFQLTAHLRTHTGECPYPCPASGCDKAFKWRSSLAHHTRSHSRQDHGLYLHSQDARSPGSQMAVGLRRTKPRVSTRGPLLQKPLGEEEEIVCWAERFVRDSDHMFGEVGTSGALIGFGDDVERVEGPKKEIMISNGKDGELSELTDRDWKQVFDELILK
mmetsp:Transcript_18594/g.49286  ORF Transcript_18594/g.49286 Transcript_18594/m.49286 type:complete len:197 (-) Transcript_18594:15-605(-)